MSLKKSSNAISVKYIDIIKMNMHPIVGKLISKLCSKLQIMLTLRENSHFSCTMKAYCLFNVGLSGVHYVYKCLDRAHFHDLKGYRFKLLVLIFHIYHFYRHDSLNYSFLASVIQYLTVVNNSLRMQKVFLSVKKTQVVNSRFLW